MHEAALKLAKGRVAAAHCLLEMAYRNGQYEKILAFGTFALRTRAAIMSATIAPTESPPTLLELMTAGVKDSGATGQDILDQLKLVHAFISAEIASSLIGDAPTSVAAQQHFDAADARVDLMLAIVISLMRAGNKAPSRELLLTLTDSASEAGLNKSTTPLAAMNERCLAALSSPFSMCVINAQSPSAAAEQMIGHSVALQECEQRYRNFRPMLELAAEQAKAPPC